MVRPIEVLAYKATRPVMVNRSQAIVLAFIAAVWLILLAILGLGPAVFETVLKPPLLEGAGADVLFVAALTMLLVVLAVGVMRRWVWMFWLVVIAFLAGLLRIPASFLEIVGFLPSVGPVWYEILQGLIGLVQFVIAVALLIGYRKAGPWGSF